MKWTDFIMNFSVFCLLLVLLLIKLMSRFIVIKVDCLRNSIISLMLVRRNEHRNKKKLIKGLVHE
jgi:hypothetical protein